MSQRTQTGKSNPRTSTLKTKKISNSINKHARSNTKKKNNSKTNSPIKRNLEPASPAVTRRQKRLSGLTAATLLQYCTNILSPSQSNDKKGKSNKRGRRSANTSPATRPSPKKSKRNSSKQSVTIEAPVPVRTRREASSRASAMIMQQNEIERSRFNYSISQTSMAPRRTAREKSPPQTRTTPVNRSSQPQDDSNSTPAPEPFQFNVPIVPVVIAAEPPAPSVTNISSQTEYAQSSRIVTDRSSHASVAKVLTVNEKYSVLTEALLAEHDRYYGTIPSYHMSKRDNLIKWTQQLTTYDCMSPPPIDSENSNESPSDHSLHSNPVLTTSHPSISSNRNRSFPKEISTISITNNLPVTMINSFPSNTNATANMHSLSRSYSFSIGQANNEHSFLPSSSPYPIDLRSFYPILPCWQYPGWNFQSPTALVNTIPTSSTSFRSHSPKNAATKSKKSQLKTTNQTKSSSQTIRAKQTLSSPKTEALTLHLHTHHHHHIHNAHSSETSLIPSRISLSSEHLDKDETIQKKTVCIQPSNDSSSSVEISKQLIKKSNRRKSSPVKRPTQISSIKTIEEKSTRGRRTRSSPIVVRRLKESPERKRTHSATSFSLLSSKRKRRKNQQSWLLFGKFERKLVLTDPEKLPVYRKCYSSIQHNKEKDIIRSGDCVLLRSGSGRQRSATPFLAKVKYFWEEPLSGEILMSLIWYYHSEHTELPKHIKEQFLPNELLASKYWDCTSADCIEDKCYVLNPNEHNRYSLREKPVKLFDHPEPVGRLKSMLNKTNISSNHRSLPPRTVDEQNVFFCRYVYDYRAKRIVKNPMLNNNFETISTT